MGKYFDNGSSPFSIQISQIVDQIQIQCSFLLYKYKYKNNVVHLHRQPNFAEFVDQAEDVLADGEGVL